MSNRQLDIAFWQYDRCRALTDGSVRIDGVDAVILSDYAKGVLTPRVTAAVIGAARRASKPVVVDPKAHDYNLYRGATLVTPNRKELAAAVHRPVTTEVEVAKAAAELAETLEAEAVLVTRSEDGMTLHVKGGEAIHIPAYPVKVNDVSGAGDTVEASCERALFATPEAAATAVSFVSAQLALLADGIAFARRDPSYEAVLVHLRRTVESDRFGIVAHALSAREGCTPERCRAFALFTDSSRVRTNLAERSYDFYVVRHASGWPPISKPPARADKGVKWGQSICKRAAIGHKRGTVLRICI